MCMPHTDVYHISDHGNATNRVKEETSLSTGIGIKLQRLSSITSSFLLLTVNLPLLYIYIRITKSVRRPCWLAVSEVARRMLFQRQNSTVRIYIYSTIPVTLDCVFTHDWQMQRHVWWASMGQFVPLLKHKERISLVSGNKLPQCVWPWRRFPPSFLDPSPFTVTRSRSRQM